MFLIYGVGVGIMETGAGYLVVGSVSRCWLERKMAWGIDRGVGR